MNLTYKVFANGNHYELPNVQKLKRTLSQQFDFL